MTMVAGEETGYSEQQHTDTTCSVKVLKIDLVFKGYRRRYSRMDTQKYIQSCVL